MPHAIPPLRHTRIATSHVLAHNGCPFFCIQALAADTPVIEYQKNSNRHEATARRIVPHTNTRRSQPCPRTMSFYEPQGWQAPVRQASWEQPAPPSRSGNSSSKQQENETKRYGGASSTSQREESNAFATQFEGITVQRSFSDSYTDSKQRSREP